MSKAYRGSCLCGAASFLVEGFSAQAAHCHCSMCRKFHGAAFATLVGVTGLRWLSGAEYLKDFVAPNGTTRTFCAACGSSLGFRVKGVPPEQMEIAIAAFDEASPVKVDAQIYTAYKAHWYEPCGGLPTFGEGREA